MSQSTFSYGLPELVSAALTLPVVSLLIASIGAVGIFTFWRRTGIDHRLAKLSDAAASAVDARYAPERRALGITAIAVIVFVLAEDLVRGYMLNLYEVVSWWRFATPVFAAFLGIAVLFTVIRFRRSGRSEQTALLGTRRTWMTFGPRAGLVGACVTVLALLVTTVAAGLASSADARGRYIYLEIPIPNESIDPFRLWFYGWAYGVPVLVCVAALTLATLGTLQSNAARPFLRSETVGVEQSARAGIAAGVVRIATAGVLLALAGAWRFIASSGSISGLTVVGDTHDHIYEAVWQYAEFAAIAGGLAPVLEIAGFVLLLRSIGQLRRGSVREQPPTLTAQTRYPEVAR